MKPQPSASMARRRRESRRVRRGSGSYGLRRPLRTRSPSVPAGRKIFLVLLFLIAQGLFAFSGVFRLGSIEVEGSRRVPRELILAQAELPPGALLWTLSPTAIARRVETLTGVQRAQVRLGLPGRVTIAVQERQPVIQVSTSAAGPWLEVDAEGVVLGPTAPSARLPRLRLEQAVEGRLETARIRPVLKALPWLTATLPEPVRYFQVDARGSLTAHTTHGGQPLVVRVGPVTGMDYKMHVLRAILERLKEEKTLAASIDLRFSSPVVMPVTPSPGVSPEP
ncbi:MAG TPA: FtsQ-type POTRA domain-containing protein [Candidatus Nitrosotenuis sp.]|nr:FtsQ-type POTRA domain-containing protein [Candidatus Nitrosotenuis sp.]